MPGVHLLGLEAAEIAALARPGQFLMVRCGEGLLLRRPFSIHGVAPPGRLALLVAEVGRGTAWLCQRPPGEVLDIIGPLGNGFSLLPGAHHLLLVAGGMGIAPLAFLAHWALEQGLSPHLLLGAPTASQLYPPSLLLAGAPVSVATEDGSLGQRGLVTDMVAERAAHADQIFACGPPAMYRALREALASFPKPVQVSLEAWMGCGLGACYACTTMTRQGPRQVCREGPVFELQDIIWDRF